MNRIKRGACKRADVNPEILLRASRRGKRMVTGANYIARGLEHLALSLITISRFFALKLNCYASGESGRRLFFFFFVALRSDGATRWFVWGPSFRIATAPQRAHPRAGYPPSRATTTTTPTTPRTRRIYARLRHRLERRDFDASHLRLPKNTPRWDIVKIGGGLCARYS